MTQHTVVAPGLATLLEQHREEIAASWVERVRQLPDSHYRELSLEELRDGAMRTLEAMVEALTTGSYAALEAFFADPGLTRLRVGFNIGELIEALLLCKDAALPVILRAHPLDSTTASKLISLLDACQRWMARQFTEVYTSEATRLLREQQARTAMMLDMVQRASSSLQLDHTLVAVAEAIATAAGVPHCGLFLVDEEQGLVTPRFDATVHAIQTVAARMGIPVKLASQPIAGVWAPTRQVVEEKKPLACTDAQTDPRFDQEAARRSGIKSLLAVPFVAKGRVVAVAWAFTLDDYHAFTEEQIELACGLADAAALTLENAQLHEQVRHLAVLEERDRLAREMHDSLAQTVGTLNLKASLIEALLSSGQIAQAQASILELKDIIREAYLDVRESIFSLHAASSSGLGFLPALQKYLAEYRTHYGVDARLVVEDELLARFPAGVEIQITRIIQEALTNVRKHAGASKAWVIFKQDGDQVCISVEDDGQGFDPAQVIGEGRHYSDLQIMRERAEGVGGSIEFDSRPGQGTRVVVRVPLAPGA